MTKLSPSITEDWLTFHYLLMVKRYDPADPGAEPKWARTGPHKARVHMSLITK